jgi:hypothetical protein
LFPILPEPFLLTSLPHDICFLVTNCAEQSTQSAVRQTGNLCMSHIIQTYDGPPHHCRCMWAVIRPLNRMSQRLRSTGNVDMYFGRLPSRGTWE